MEIPNYSILSIKEEFDKHPLPSLDKDYSRNDDFIADLVAVSNLVLLFLRIAAIIIPNGKFNKAQQGILLSHMVRLFKLYDCILLLICEHRFEIAILLSRSAAETAIVLKYLTININDELCRKFIKSSLAYDKKLHDLIKKNSSNRKLLPIEERMLKSIANTFAKTEFKLEDIKFQEDKKWHENVSVMAKEVGLERYYETIYRVGSGAEHGSWHYLELYHLQEKTDYYEPQLDYSTPSPQLLEAVNYICLQATKDYIERVNPDKVFLDLIKIVIKWHEDIGNKHEEYLMKRKQDEE